MTIADIVILTSLSTLDLLFFVEKDDYPLLGDWFERMKQIPEYEINRKGLEAMKSTMEELGKFQYPQRN